MSRLLLFVLLFLSFHAAFGQQPRRMESIRDFEKARYQALLNSDLTTLGKLVATELMYTHSNGNVENKTAYLAAIENRTYTFQKFETDSTIYRFLNCKMVVATGVARIAGTYLDKPFDIGSRFTAVYVRRKKQWQLHTWQTTRVR